MSKKIHNDWQSILRQAITESDMSLKQIADLAKTDHSQLSRFMRGQRGLTFVTAERLGNLLGLELVKGGGK